MLIQLSVPEHHSTALRLKHWNYLQYIFGAVPDYVICTIKDKYRGVSQPLQSPKTHRIACSLVRHNATITVLAVDMVKYLQ